MTILARRRWTHPLQALDPVRAEDGSLCLMLLNTSGGMVGGDRLLTEIEVGPDASAVLVTASAGKVYRSAGPPAIHTTTIKMHPGAVIEYLPDHLIPHPGAKLRQSLHVEMAPGGRAIIYDAIAVGRVGRGERWQFAELYLELRISRDRGPVYLDRSRIVPHEFELSQLGLAENFNYIASFLVLDDEVRDWNRFTAELDDLLAERKGVWGGASILAAGGCIVKLMSCSATDLNQLAYLLWSLSRRRLLGLEAFDSRKL
jgi:urease accessory protein